MPERAYNRESEINPANESQRAGRYDADTGEHHDRRHRCVLGMGSRCLELTVIAFAFVQCLKMSSA